MEITIRHSEQRDLASIRDIMSHPDVFGQTLHLPYPSAEQWQKRHEAFDENNLSLVAEFGGNVVGHAQLWVETRARRRHVATIGLAVQHNYQSKGIGARLTHALLDLAFNWVGVKRVELTVYADNEKAIRLYKKYGFVEEGRAVASSLRQGEYVDVIYMAKLYQAQMTLPEALEQVEIQQQMQEQQ